MHGDASAGGGVGRLLVLVQQFVQRGHDAAVRIGGQFVGGGDAVGHSGKVYPGGPGRFGIDGAVAHVEHVRLFDAQPLDGQQQPLGVGLGAGDVFAAHHNVQKVGGEVLVQQFVDAEAVFGGDDAHAGAALLQRLQHVQGLGEEARVGRHVHVGFPAVFGFEGRQARRVVDARQQGERLFQRLADGAADGVVGHVAVAVALEHVAETHHDAARRVGQGVVEVKEIGCVGHWGIINDNG